MIDRLLALFSDAPKPRTRHDIQLAGAALLVEIMRADHHIGADEMTALSTVLTRLFALTTEESDALIQQARSQVTASNDLFQFTDVVNSHWNDDEKYQLIYGLWQVAYADQVLDKYEEHMVRRVADLLYVPHSQFIRARNEARNARSSHP